MSERLKFILYGSQAKLHSQDETVPVDLSHILLTSVKRNRVHGVTGFMVYKAGYFMQLIEGKQSVVEELYSHIRVDSRHSDVETIIESSIVEPVFSTWSMKLIASLDDSPECLYFFRRYAHLLNHLPPGSQKMLEVFYDGKQAENESNNKVITEPCESKYKAMSLALLSWPDFDSLQNSPVKIELTARLVAGDCSYDELMALGEFDSPDTLDTILADFDQQGILQTKVDKSVKAPAHQPKKNHFYHLMKDFLFPPSSGGE